MWFLYEDGVRTPLLFNNKNIGDLPRISGRPPAADSTHVWYLHFIHASVTEQNIDYKKLYIHNIVTLSIWMAACTWLWTHQLGTVGHTSMPKLARKLIHPLIATAVGTKSVTALNAYSFLERLRSCWPNKWKGRHHKLLQSIEHFCHRVFLMASSPA